jgi:hypothetical protein
MFTNYNNTNKINKLVSRLLMKSRAHFVTNTVAGTPDANYIKSHRRT